MAVSDEDDDQGAGANSFPDEQSSSGRETADERKRADAGESAVGEKAKQVSARQAAEHDDTLRTRPADETARPEQHSDVGGFRQQWPAHVAQVRQWVAESDTSASDPPDIPHAPPPAAAHLQEPPAEQPERAQEFLEDLQPRPTKAGESEDVRLSIGRIQLMVDAPEPSPPQPQRKERGSGRPTDERMPRLSRYYLRR